MPFVGRCRSDAVSGLSTSGIGVFPRRQLTSTGSGVQGSARPGREAQWFTISLDPGDLAADAAAGLVCSFNEGEYASCLIDPCPTLKELAGG